MLSNFSSLLELLAGVYFTICLDNVLTHKIWTVDYFAAFKKSLESMSFAGNTSIATDVVDNNRDLVSIMQARLTKKSVYMLVYITIMLIVCGVEASTNDEIEKDKLYLFNMMISIATLIALCFSKKIFLKWEYTSIFILFSLLVSLISVSIPALFSFYSNYVSIPRVYVIRFTLFLVLIPILWQIFSVWVYKGLYYDYMNYSMIKLRDEYESVLDIVQNNGDTTRLPDEYGKILQENALKHKEDKTQKAIDNSITDYTLLLQNKLRNLGYETTMIKVLVSIFKIKRYAKTMKKQTQNETFKNEDNNLKNYINKNNVND